MNHARPEVHHSAGRYLADKLGADDNSARFKALVLLAGWCGLRYGEVSELRRKDFNADCSIVSVSRGVTHRQGQCLIGSAKTGAQERVVTIPPHIRDDVKAHLQRYVAKGDDALLFAPARGGCHLNDRVFNKDVFQKAAKDIGREDLSAHDLRRFAGTKNAAVSSLAENMARLGHKTVDAALRYHHSQDGRDAVVAANLSANALAELAAAKDRPEPTCGVCPGNHLCSGSQRRADTASARLRVRPELLRCLRSDRQ